ncbi:type I pantothenate kinase [Candidatus Fukatsuia anoeciicola]|uniref:type I pantothenate kinase n=1 Tax=Candidatus Fukatsuia anoeciicola TaxID=2994492 RepID=UPI003464AC57
MYYLKFNRTQWAALRHLIPFTLIKKEFINLQEINKNLLPEEVAQIYLPLSCLLNFYINSKFNHQVMLKQFLGNYRQKIPYIIGITGSVAVGKSTVARLLQILLSRWPEHQCVELVTTDSFLYPNKVLHERGLIKKKGFPQSYDIYNLINFITKIKSGDHQVKAPFYSHLMYDIVPNGNKFIKQPDILILEGLNILQSWINYTNNLNYIFISDFIDFSIYIDAPENLLKNWYINRFLRFRQNAFTNPNSYFYHYTLLSEKETAKIADQLWDEINGLNLKQNILPTRKRASLIIKKSVNHVVKSIWLRK